MKKLNKLFPVVLLMSVLAGCGKKEAEAEAEPATEAAATPGENKEEAGGKAAEGPADVATLSPAEQQVAGIRLGQPQLRSLSGGLKVNGELDVPPANASQVSAPLGGFIEKTTLLQGARVRKGELLATIRNPEFVQLQQTYLETRSQLQYARAEYERQEELYRQEVAPQKNFQKARAEYQAIQVQLGAQAARLRLANLPVGGGFVTTAPVRAPRGGYLKTANVSVGQSVTPTDILFEIVDPAHLDVALTVFERDVARLREGQRVRFSLGNDSADTDRTAKVYLIGRSVTQDRTVRVYAHLDKEDANQRPGTFVRAVIETNTAQRLALPDKALVLFEGRSYVFVAQGPAEHKGETAYRMVPVVPGVSEDGYTAVELPREVDPGKTPVVLEGAYALLAKLKNAAEEE